MLLKNHLLITILGILSTILFGSYFYSIVYAEEIKIELNNGKANIFDPGSTIYKVVGVSKKLVGISGLQVGDSEHSAASVSNKSINLNFALKVPDPTNSAKMSVKNINLYLKVKSIDGISNGRKIYVADPAYSQVTIVDHDITNATITQDGKMALVTLNLK
jgi:hypothetical protein